MAVILTQNPGTHNFAYGANAVTLSGITGSAQKYVLQIRAMDGTTILASLRQSTNMNNVAQFDIQNVLQSYVGVPPDTIDNLGIGFGIFKTSNTEIYQYILRVGSESNGVLTIEPTVYGNYQVVAGAKEYWQVNAAPSIIDDPTYRLRPVVETEGGGGDCYTVGDAGNPLSGVRRSYTKFGNPYAWPNGDNSWDTVEKVYVEEARDDERLTKSYWNQMALQQGAPSSANYIGGFQILVFNNNTQVDDVVIPNTTVNGGGPNQVVNPGQPETGSGSSLIITMGIGPANLNNFGYNDGGSATTFSLPANWTHYYITPVATQTDNTCGSGVDQGVWGEPLTNPTLVLRKEGNCSDFDPIRFSWVNQYGFMDYYSFDKKNVKTVKTKRNTYLKESNDYNSSAFYIGRGDRGVTTYSMKSEEQYEANTGYMTDAEAETLQYLFRSADVRVQSNRFNTQDYIPVVITDTKWMEKTNRVDQLFQYTVKFKIAHNIKTQRGN